MYSYLMFDYDLNKRFFFFLEKNVRNQILLTYIHLYVMIKLHEYNAMLNNILRNIYIKYGHKFVI
jgi:hypothetical protein